MGKISKRTEIHVNRVLDELELIKTLITKTVDHRRDRSYYLRQVDNAILILSNILVEKSDREA